MKWYDTPESQHDVIAASRVRLARNIRGPVFCDRMKEEERRALRGRLKEKTAPVLAGCEYLETDLLPEGERKALRERRLINSNLASRTEPMGLFFSADDETSVLLCGDDHLRLQLTKPGLSLLPAWEELDALDDMLSERLEYAFDEKYGYLTAFPTNVGTGLRATAVVHLPALCQDRSFRKMLSEMNRFGIMVRPFYGDGSDNYGALYEVCNQKTLGLSEAEIIGSVQRMASQLSGQEKRLRSQIREKRGKEQEDAAWKAYGVLHYARRLTLKEAMNYLSCLRAALNDRYLELEKPVSVYGLMLASQDAALAPGRGESPEEARAAMIRRRLPEPRK